MLDIVRMENVGSLLDIVGMGSAGSVLMWRAEVQYLTSWEWGGQSFSA